MEAYDGATGLSLALEQDPDLILLDLMLPELDGFQVCRTLREHGRSTPVLIITAREEEKDKVLGLELGADDYITKPFSIRELLARVKANIRRVNMLQPQMEVHSESKNRIIIGRILIDCDCVRVSKDGKDLELTQREYELVKFLAVHAGKVFSRQELMESVWNYEGFLGDVRGVDVTVRRLREKLEDDPAQPTFILTRRGLGYYFSV
jgi:two-component system response regulator VicR